MWISEWGSENRGNLMLDPALALNRPNFFWIWRLELPVSVRRAVRPGLTADSIEDEVFGVILAGLGGQVARLPNL
jgi:hypothetical protein